MRWGEVPRGGFGLEMQDLGQRDGGTGALDTEYRGLELGPWGRPGDWGRAGRGECGGEDTEGAGSLEKRAAWGWRRERSAWSLGSIFSHFLLEIVRAPFVCPPAATPSFYRTPSRHLSRPPMVERFFSYASTAPPRHEEAGITLLSGPPCCGKTSLLFQFAVNRSEESGRGVVFICSKGRLETNPPFLSHGIDPAMPALQRIQIKYVEDGEEIKKYFAAFHLLDNFPAAVIVDDFADFLSERTCQQRYGNTRARDLAMVRILAVCHDAISHANAKLGPLGSCNLLLSDVHQGDTPRLLFIYKRWMSSIYAVQGDSTGSYILKNIGGEESGTREARAAKYSIALQYLVLEEISC